MYGNQGHIPGLLDESLEAESRWSCPTGNLQFGWIAMRLSSEVGDRKLKRFGQRLIEKTASTQVLTSKNVGIRGGVFGSTPIFGKYHPYCTVSWGAKYLLDGLLEL
jgi:hypothetical protein